MIDKILTAVFLVWMFVLIFLIGRVYGQRSQKEKMIEDMVQINMRCWTAHRECLQDQAPDEKELMKFYRHYYEEKYNDRQ